MTELIQYLEELRAPDGSLTLSAQQVLTVLNWIAACSRIMQLQSQHLAELQVEIEKLPQRIADLLPPKAGEEDV